MKIWIAILAALLGGLLYLLHRQFPYAFSVDQSYLTLLSMILVLASVVFGVAKSGVSKELVIKSAIIWLSISIAGLSAYSYQWELKQYFNRILGQLAPSLAQTNKEGSVTFYAGDNGHFMMDSLVNGRNIHFLLDTGASRVTLSADDAKSLGIDLDTLRFDIAVNTAKGVNFVAYFRLDSIQIGNIVVKDVDAYVSKEGLSGSLLGMSFLNKLSRYQIDKNKITFWE